MDRLRKIGFSKLTSLEEALKRLFSHIQTIHAEEIHTMQSLGRILANEIISNINIPPFDRSAMDGYAIKANDTFGCSIQNPSKLSVIGKIEIGQPSQGMKINEGEAIKISTGAAMPEGADAVVKIEDTELDNNKISIYSPLVPSKNVIYKGEDINQGTRVLEAGTELRPAHIALLVSIGLGQVKVRAKPKVSIFATGDELVEVGNTLLENKIYNSNSPMISNLITLYGGIVVRNEVLIDDKLLLKNKLQEAVQDSDFVMFTGGTSVGTHDFLPDVIKESGEIINNGIAIKPGASALIGIVQNKIVFCLPGTPVAAYVCFTEIAGLALRKIMDTKKIDPRIVLPAKISKDVPLSGMGYSNYLRVKIEKKEGEMIVEPIKLKGSGIISSLFNI
ncbi:MAG: gephyrin-like molybdotransferase Glp [Promethearchaeota archaeon]